MPDLPPAFSARKVRLVRRRLGMSQAIFARLLAVSPVTLQKWEQGRKSPSPQSRRLLEIAQRHPEIFADQLSTKAVLSGS
jgi:putative transcriptional regulator